MGILSFLIHFLGSTDAAYPELNKMMVDWGFDEEPGKVPYSELSFLLK
jgi:hypothetical protein